MRLSDHLRLTGSAVKHWFIGQLLDSLAVMVLWTVGLLIIGVPWAFFWAALAAILQFVPHLGPILGLLGPIITATLKWGGWEHPLYVLILYAIIVVVDGLFLQPYIMRRSAKVPIWASLLTPIVLGLMLPFWGVLLAPPVLAIVFAYRERHRQASGVLRS